MCVLFASLFNPLPVAMTVSAVVLIVAFLLTLARLWRGPSPMDRIMALDLAGGCALAVMVWFAIHFGHPGMVDVAVVLAVIGFLSTTALAGWLARKGGDS
jgi:multisubunit Na+/H+ antiporter MnhF subunit